MHPIYPHAQVSFSMDIAWSRDNVSHVDRYYVNRLNCWRDLFPGSFLSHALAPGSRRRFDPEPGELVPAVDPDLILDLSRSRINDLVPFRKITPGRFYPRGAVRGIPGVFKGNLIPFRCTGKDDRGIIADFNPPLAGIPLTLTLGEMEWEDRGRERGGSCTDWMAAALSGPGMQARSGGSPTRFFTAGAFDRQDPSGDEIFYGQDRFVHHIDRRASQTLARWYAGLLPRRGRVLDLMAGWTSHLSGEDTAAEVYGIGLNPRELAANTVLTDFTVQDLNQWPDLDFPEHYFDAAVCSLSVEYLVDPVRTFTAVARVLKPGAAFAIGFSNRWFPEKSIRIWTELHEFERVGLVLDYFRRSGRFTDLSAVSVRGYPRPETDRYFPQLRFSDPVYGVCGKVRD